MAFELFEVDDEFKALMTPDQIREIVGNDPEHPTTKELQDIEWAKRTSYYVSIQKYCLRSGHYIEHYDFVDMPTPPLPICPRPEDIAPEYIEKYGFDPEVTCYHCGDKDLGGDNEDDKLEELCDPCNPCINYEYDDECRKVRKYYLIFDQKAVRYWQHPSTKLFVYNCEKEAIEAWESDTPPASKSKQEISFYDPLKRKGKLCPYKTYPPETEYKDKLKIANSFKWCVPTWNDQCRFVIVEFYCELWDVTNDTITTQWKVMKKCNQEECDLGGEDAMNSLGRHAKLCKDRCYVVDHPNDDPWIGNLVNYTHHYW